MGSDYQESGAVGPREVLTILNRYLPGAFANVQGQIPQTAEATLRAANEQVNPKDPSLLGYNALNLQQLQRYALPQAEVGQQVANSNALAGARTNAAQLSGPGGEAARGATSLNKELNPNYYSSLDAASRGANAAVGAINLNGLSPGESNAVERATNQSNTSTGNLGLNNPTNIISNAMNFGGAFNSKVGLMNQASANAANVANTASSGGGVNPVSIALGQPNPSTATNFGAGQFQTTTPISAAGPAGNTFGFTQATQGALTSSNAAAQAAGASMANATSPAAYLGAV